MYDNYNCNICGKEADFEVEMELIRISDIIRNPIKTQNVIPFYLCMQHEYLYKHMMDNVEITEYFSETLDTNK